MLDHPARFALVEINNVHDAGINFEPIHRVLFNINNDDLFNGMAKYFESIGSELNVEHYDTKDDAKEHALTWLMLSRGQFQPNDGYQALSDMA